MAFRYTRFRRISALFSGVRFHECVQINKLSAFSPTPLAYTLENIFASGTCRIMHASSFSRFSTVAARSKEVSCELDLISFVRSTSDLAEGPYHCWINRVEGSKEFLRKGGIYLLLADVFLDDPPGSWVNRITMLEKVKLLQQRYPCLQVFGFQSCSSVSSMADRSILTNVIMEEYISFPILLCSKNFPKVASGTFCILFEGLKNPPIYKESDVDLSILHKVIQDLNKQLVEDTVNFDKLKSSWSKKTAGFKEPYICSYLQNMPLFHPACISADEQGNRYFLSDSNHHRVIVFDSTGKILDVIGSSPGYDDGEFETAKLMRPAASWYHASEDCLYLVDSENHAIRRADLGTRVLETLYPTIADKGDSGILSWILVKLGFKSEVGLKSVAVDQTSLLLFPWHLLKSKDNDLLVLNRSLETLWVMDLDNGMVRDVVKGNGSIMEFCGKQIMDKVSDLQGLPSDILQQLLNSSPSLGGISYSGFLSSFVTTGEDLLICDTVGQTVLMLNKLAKVASSVQLSNFRVLGLPYWLTYSLERVFPCGDKCGETRFDHLQSFFLLPGKIDVHVAIDIPDNTELVEPLHEDCVWRQTRGTAMEVLGIKTIVVTSDKVGVAQKWYDEMDSFVSGIEQEEPKEEIQPLCKDSQDGKVHIDCIIKTSPGTSEVIVSAPLYLKLRSSSNTCNDNSQDMKAAKIADILKPDLSGRLERDTLIQLLLKLNRDLGELVFLKPLHVKISFDTLNHPKPKNTRDIILTDYTVDVNVSL